MADQSVKNGNFFQFTNLDRKTRLITEAKKFNMIKYDSRVEFSPSYTINGDLKAFLPRNLLNLADSQRCQAFNTAFDCTVANPPEICKSFKQTNPSITHTDPSVISCTNLASYEICNPLLNALNYTDFPTGTDYTTYLAECFGGALPTKITVKARLYIGRINLSATKVMEKLPLTFHYLQLYSSTKDDWLVTATEERLWTFPSTSMTLPLESALNDLPDNDKPYKTIYKVQLVKHNLTSVVYCRYSLTFTGFVRGVYVNEYLGGIHAPQGIGLDIQTSVESSIRVPLEPDSLNFVTIMGYRINQTQLQFIDCGTTWNEPNTTNVQFSYFYYTEALLASQDKVPSDNQLPPGYDPYNFDSHCSRFSRYSCIACLSTARIFAGVCLYHCANNGYENAARSCVNASESIGVLMENPTINGNLITVKGYIDVPDTVKYALVAHSTNEMGVIGYALYAPILGISSMAESYPVLLTRNDGFYDIELNLVSTGSVSVANSRKVHVLYYRLDQSSGQTSLPGVYWGGTVYESISPTSLKQPTLKNPTWNGNADFLSSSKVHAFVGFLECHQSCQVSVTSNGNVTFIKNDRTVLFDLNFISQWEYVYDQIPTNTFFHLQFRVAKGTYSRILFSGSDFTLYEPSPPLFSHIIDPLNVDACNIANCRNCKGSICLSCNPGYYLTTDQSQCTTNCGAGQKYYQPERRCVTQCTGPLRDANNTHCIPECNKPGYIFSTQQGCIPCVDDCAVCASVNTCSQCHALATQISPTFCQRKTGSVFSSTDFSVSQTVQLSADYSTNEYALFITDKSRYQDLVFHFINQPRAIPRIIKVLKFPNLSSITIPPLSISEPGEISFHYLKIKKTNTSPLQATAAGFSLAVYTNWPIYSQTSVSNSNTTFLNAPIINSYSSLAYYSTIISWKLYQSNSAFRIFCRGYLNGMIRYTRIFVNGEQIFFDAGLNSNGYNIISYTKTIIFEPQEMTVFMFVGQGYNVYELSFKDCVDGLGNSVSPTFDSYIVIDQESSSNNFNIMNTTCCAKNCKNCINNTHCLLCSEGFYLRDGECHPRCQSPLSRYSLYGFCDSIVRGQGYIFINYKAAFNPTTEILNLGLKTPIEYNGTVILIVHPFHLNYSNYPGYERFNPSNSLAESSYYTSNIIGLTEVSTKTINIKLKPTTHETGSSPFTNIHIDMHTIKQDKILLIIWQSPPLTISQSLEADSFEYVNSTDTIFSFEPDYQYKLCFFLNCTDNCTLTLNMTGNIEIYLNDRTSVFQAHFDSGVAPVILNRNFTGINFFTMKVQDSSRMNLTFNGTYKIFSLHQFIINEIGVATIPSTLCTATNCLNCYKDRCLSCPKGRFLTSSGQCETTCTPLLSVESESICIDGTCESLGLVLRDDSCVMKCNKQGIYYGSNGCASTNLCHATCEDCSGPSASHCLSCASPRQLTSSHSCICPPQYKQASNGECGDLTIEIRPQPLIQSCFDLKLEATTSQLKDDNIFVDWQVTSSTTTPSTVLALNSYLSSQKSLNITIPASYLDSGHIYNFTVFNTQSIQNWTIINTFGDFVINASVADGNSKIFNVTDVNTIRIKVDYSSCFQSPPSFSAKWSYLEGNFIDLKPLYNAANPLELIIPRNYQSMAGQSLVKVKVWIGAQIQFAEELTLNLTFVPGEQYEDIDSMVSTGQTAKSVTTMLLTAINLFNPSSSGLIMLGRVSQSLEYMRYLNISYPTKVKAMFKAIDKTTSPLSIEFEAIDEVKEGSESDKLPYNFAQYDISSSYLENFWDDLMYLAINIGGVVITVAFEILSKKYLKQQVVISIMHKFKVFAQNYLIMQFYSTYGDNILFFFLTVISMRLDSGLSYLNLLVSLLYTLLGLPIFCFHYYLLRNHHIVKKKIHDEKMTAEIENYKTKYECVTILFEDFKDYTFIQQACLLISTIKMVIFTLIVGSLLLFPILQCVIFVVLNLGIIAYLLIKRPHKDILALIQEAVYECLLLVVNLTVMSLAISELRNGSNDNEDRGEIIIKCNFVFIFLPIFFQAIKGLIFGYEYTKNKTKKFSFKIRRFRHQELDRKDVVEQKNDNDLNNSHATTIHDNISVANLVETGHEINLPNSSIAITGDVHERPSFLLENEDSIIPRDRLLKNKMMIEEWRRLRSRLQKP